MARGTVSSAKRGWKEADSARRRVVEEGLFDLFAEAMFDDTTLGEQIGRCSTEAEARHIFEDVLRTKATATLDKRWSSLKLYLRWFRAARPHRQPQVAEPDAYAYVRALVDEGAPPTILAVMSPAPIASLAS